MDSPTELCFALMQAIADRNIDAVEELLKMSNPADFRNVGEDSLLHYAVLSGSTAVIGLLLKEPLLQSLINGFDGTSATPLILAVRRNRCDIVNLLLVAGADVNAHDEARIGNTAIREAVDEGNAEIIKLLLGAGADPTITGWMQNNAVHRAQKQYDMNPSPERKAVLELINESLSKRILPRRPVSAD